MITATLNSVIFSIPDLVSSTRSSCFRIFLLRQLYFLLQKLEQDCKTAHKKTPREIDMSIYTTLYLPSHLDVRTFFNKSECLTVLEVYN